MTRQITEGAPSSDILDTEEFLAQYAAVEALIDEADETSDTNLLDLAEEKQSCLETENPSATRRLKRERLEALDRGERRERLKVGQAAIRARLSRD